MDALARESRGYVRHVRRCFHDEFPLAGVWEKSTYSGL